MGNKYDISIKKPFILYKSFLFDYFHEQDSVSSLFNNYSFTFVYFFISLNLIMFH